MAFIFKGVLEWVCDIAFFVLYTADPGMVSEQFHLLQLECKDLDFTGCKEKPSSAPLLPG